MLEPNDQLPERKRTQKRLFLCIAAILIGLAKVAIASQCDLEESGSTVSRWIATTPVPEPSGLARHALALWRDKLYVLGGKSSSTIYRTRLLTDGGVEYWETLPTTLPGQIYDACAFVHKGRMYLIGGYDATPGVGDYLNKIHFVSLSNSNLDWQTHVSSVMPGIAQHACVINGDTIYVIGGWGEQSPGVFGPLSTVYAISLDPADGTVSSTKKLTITLKQPLTGLAAVSYKNVIYVVGGNTGTTNPSPSTSIYSGTIDLTSGVIPEWVALSLSLPVPLWNHDAVILDDNIYVSGGQNKDLNSSEKVYIASVQEKGELKGWDEAPALPISLTRHASAASDVGGIYIVGGISGTTYQSVVYHSPVASASLVKFADPNHSVTYNDILTYTIRYINTGSTDLVSLTITDAIPLGTELVPDSISDGGVESNDVIRWLDPGPLPIGAQKEVHFRVRVSAPETNALKAVTVDSGANATSVSKYENGLHYMLAVLPSWFNSDEANEFKTAFNHPLHSNTEMAYTRHSLAPQDDFSHHASTVQFNPIPSSVYQNTGSNRVSVASPIPMPVAPATHTTWAQTCTLAHLEVLGKGMSDTLTATLTIPNLDSIVSDSMRIQVALKISPGGEASQIAEVILLTGDSDFRLATPTSVDDFMAVYELDVPVSEAVTVTVVPISDVMTRTDSLIAYVWRTAIEGRGTGGWTDNKAVYWDGPRPGYSRTLSLPPLTESGNVTVQVAVADNDPDHNERVLYLEAEAGGVTATKTITIPSHGSYLDIHSLVLTNVPVGITDVTVTVASPPNTGDSLGLLGAVAEAACQSTPAVLGVHPDTLCNDVENEITIEGTDFVPTPQVQLDSTELLNVIFVSPNTLTAAVPSGMAQGIYSLTVTNPGGGNLFDTLTNALTVAHAAITVTGVQPGWGTNDRATLITVTGENLKPTPTLWLGDIELSGVAYLSPTAVTAVVTPGLTPGYYDLTVTNPKPCQRSATIGTAFRVDFSPVIITNVAYLCSDQTGCVPSNPVMNTPYRVYLPIVMKSYATP